MDTSNVKIKVLPKMMTSEEIDDVVKNAAKRQQEKLREKYSKYKGG